MRWVRAGDVWVVWQGRVGALIKLIISHYQSTALNLIYRAFTINYEISILEQHF
jgi:hypothetical protein